MTEPPRRDSVPTTRIDRFAGEYRFLSNFFRSPVTDERGVKHPTVEHAYQATKATTDQDRNRIAAAKHPSKAKRIGGTLAVDAAWPARKDEVMRRLLVQKFAPGSDLAVKLLATGTAELIEGNVWGDTYWGAVDGVGENRLGRMLMDIRRELLSRDHGAPRGTPHGVPHA
jgi:ribA/ribD-fused uncharacterized protein